MAKSRLIAVIGVVLFGLAAHAVNSNTTKYPLRIQVRHAAYGCANCSPMPLFGPRVIGGFSDDPAPLGIGGPEFQGALFFGHGDAVVLDVNRMLAFRYSYDYCADPLPLTNGTATLAARWTKAGQGLEVLVPQYTLKKRVNFGEKYKTQCRLTVSMPR